MLQLWTIALVVVMGVDRLLPRLWGTGAGGEGGGAGEEFWVWRLVLALAPMVAIAVAVQMVCRAAARAMDERGDGRAVGWADWMVGCSLPLVVGAHAAAVWGLGLVDVLAGLLGGSGMLAQCAAMLPALLVFVGNWWGMYPIERRLSDARMMRDLDLGLPVYAPATRGQYVWGRVRHDLLLVLLPMLLIWVWTGMVEFVVGWARVSGGRASDWPGELVEAGGQLVGVVLVLGLAPALMRHVWDTVRLGEGELRDELMSLCRGAGVRVQEILVWRTNHAMVNGAAMGLIPRLRYILLTDGLLEKLPRGQLRAVMAHEIGHVKHRHIPWLMLGVVSAIGVTGSVVTAGLWMLDWGLEMIVPGAGGTAWHGVYVGVSNGAGLVVGLVGVVLVFGLISRRFEWQADAFAVERLSIDEGSATISPRAVDAMCGALQSVADLGNVPIMRWSFRHGSIGLRQRRLRGLVGTIVDGARINTTARWIKVATLVGLAATIALAVNDAMSVSEKGAESRAEDVGAGKTGSGS